MENFKFDGSDDKFNEIILNTCLLSLAIYEDDPLSYLNNFIQTNKFKNSLGKVCVSEKLTEDEVFGDEFTEINIRYLVSKNEKNKTIIIAFRGDENLSSLLRDGKHYPKINSEKFFLETETFKKCSKIPTNYFIEKLDKDFKIIFTGFSYGGSLAAMETINLFFEYIGFKSKKNILFIGYGCPDISEISHHEDFLVNLLDYLIDVIYFQREFCKKTIHDFAYYAVEHCEESDVGLFDLLDRFANLTSRPRPDEGKTEGFLFNFINNILKDIESIDDLRKDCELFRNSLNSEKLELEFSSSNQSKIRKFLILNENNQFMIKNQKPRLLKIDFRDTDNLINRIQSHLIRKYFSCLNKNYFTRLLKENDECSKIEHLKDLEISVNKSELSSLTCQTEKTYLKFKIKFEPENS
ncbi:unnamed protein product [Brachionus calyciflorus]|uniref:Fungal lipase-type domain-containing protein n=1 Tax=Brachionus calyciflorus TaxID=104777 RepID=A0A813M5R9_9BILA|nr:unnamed protein product [Brachionus calyciflorus]